MPRLVSSGHGSALIAVRPCHVLDLSDSGCKGGYDMSSIRYAGTSYVDIKANHIHFDGSLLSAARARKVIQVFAVVLAAASLASCAQSSVVTKNSGLPGG